MQPVAKNKEEEEQRLLVADEKLPKHEEPNEDDGDDQELNLEASEPSNDLGMMYADEIDDEYKPGEAGQRPVSVNQPDYWIKAGVATYQEK